MDDNRTDRGMLAVLTLHLICCAGPLLIFGVISLGSALTWQRVIGAIPYLALFGVLVGAAILYYYFAHGCRRCSRAPDEPRREP